MWAPPTNHRADPQLIDELRRFAPRGNVLTSGEEPMPGFDSEGANFRGASDSFAPVRKPPAATGDVATREVRRAFSGGFRGARHAADAPPMPKALERRPGCARLSSARQFQECSL